METQKNEMDKLRTEGKRMFFKALLLTKAMFPGFMQTRSAEEKIQLEPFGKKLDELMEEGNLIFPGE